MISHRKTVVGLSRTGFYVSFSAVMTGKNYALC